MGTSDRCQCPTHACFFGMTFSGVLGHIWWEYQCGASEQEMSSRDSRYSYPNVGLSSATFRWPNTTEMAFKWQRTLYQPFVLKNIMKLWAPKLGIRLWSACNNWFVNTTIILRQLFWINRTSWVMICIHSLHSLLRPMVIHKNKYPEII